MEEKNVCMRFIEHYVWDAVIIAMRVQIYDFWRTSSWFRAGVSASALLAFEPDPPSAWGRVL